MSKEKPNNQTDELAELKARIETLEKSAQCQTPNCTGGMLSSADFLNLVIIQDVKNAKKDFWKRNWENWKNKFIIEPFNPKQLTPFSYDLSIGKEVYSCNEEKVTPLDNENTYNVAPGETIVVKTEEFIALPPDYSATVWPRFKMPTEAIFQSMVKIDPTWFGELGVAMTNISVATYPISRGEKFATLILYGLRSPTGMFLYRKEDLPDHNKISLVNSIDIDVIKRKLKCNKLESVCQIVDDKLVFTDIPDDKQFKSLITIHSSEEWRNVIISYLGEHPRQMDGLGLNTLDIIKPKPPKGIRLSPYDIRNKFWKETDLENIAIKHGPPFDVLPAIPDLIMQNIEQEVSPRICAEVEARVYPKTVTLTLTVLGFLSLILGVLAFLMDKYRKESPLAGIDWPGTAVIGIATLGVVLLLSLLILLIRKSPDSRGIRSLKGELKKITDSNREKTKKLNNLESELQNLKNVDKEKEVKFEKAIKEITSKITEDKNRTEEKTI